MTYKWILIFLLSCFTLSADILLKDNLKSAEKGDYLVIAQGKSYTLFHVFNKDEKSLTIEEITIPQDFAQTFVKSWKEWILQNAPYHTSWVLYQINLTSGKLDRFYSFTRGGAFSVPDAENFLNTLLNLVLSPVPENQRKKVGIAPLIGEDTRPFWAPPLVVNGKIIQGVNFVPYLTTWPNDGGPLASKTIEVYLPAEDSKFPSYFPYWLQVHGVLGPAKVRIADSGKGLISPKTGYPR